jgi:hypothetical protein
VCKMPEYIQCQKQLSDKNETQDTVTNQHMDDMHHPTTGSGCTQHEVLCVDTDEFNHNKIIQFLNHLQVNHVDTANADLWLKSIRFPC